MFQSVHLSGVLNADVCDLSYGTLIVTDPHFDRLRLTCI